MFGLRGNGVFIKIIAAISKSYHDFFSLMQLGPLVSQLMPVVEASPVSSMAKGAAGTRLKIVFN